MSIASDIKAVIDMSLDASRELDSPVIFQAGKPTQKQLEKNRDVINIRVHAITGDVSYGFSVGPGGEIKEWPAWLAGKTYHRPASEMPEHRLRAIIDIAQRLQLQDRLLDRFIKREREYGIWLAVVEGVRLRLTEGHIEEERNYEMQAR